MPSVTIREQCTLPLFENQFKIGYSKNNTFAILVWLLRYQSKEKFFFSRLDAWLHDEAEHFSQCNIDVEHDIGNWQVTPSIFQGVHITSSTSKYLSGHVAQYPEIPLQQLPASQQSLIVVRKWDLDPRFTTPYIKRHPNLICIRAFHYLFGVVCIKY